MKKVNLKLYESRFSPKNTDVLWVQMDYNSSEIKTIYRYNISNGQWEPFLDQHNSSASNNSWACNHIDEGSTVRYSKLVSDGTFNFIQIATSSPIPNDINTIVFDYVVDFIHKGSSSSISLSSSFAYTSQSQDYIDICSATIMLYGLNSAINDKITQYETYIRIVSSPEQFITNGMLNGKQYTESEVSTSDNITYSGNIVKVSGINPDNYYESELEQ